MESLFDEYGRIPPKECDVFDLLPDNYKKVSDVEAIIIIILSIYGSFYGKKDLYKKVYNVVSKSSFLRLPNLDDDLLRVALDKLLHKKIVACQHSNYSLYPDSMLGVPQKALANKAFQEVVAKTFVQKYSWSMSEEQIRFCILTKRSQLGENRLRIRDYGDGLNGLRNLVIELKDMSLLDYSFLEEIVDADSEVIFQKILHSLPDNEEFLAMMLDWFLHLSAQAKQISFFSVASCLALSGTPSQIDRLVEDYLKISKKHHLALGNISFVADMLRGDLVQAREKADLFKLAWNDFNGNKKKEMPFAIGGFYAILLSQSGSAPDAKNALTYLRTAIKMFKEYGLTHAIGMEFVKLLLDYFAAKQKGHKITFNDYYYSPEFIKGWMNIIFAWEGKTDDFKSLSVDSLAINPRFELEMRGCGLYPPSENSKVSQARLMVLEKELGMKPLSQLIEADPEWVDMLKVFENVAALKGAKEKGVSERMVWRVDFDINEIQPYYQKMQKAGWSKGRNIALRTLFSKTPTYASDTDVQIINQLKRYDGWHYVEYDWDYAKCLPLFVNHPLLFTISDPMLPVALKEEEVSLIVKEKGDELHISLSADIDATLIKESDRSYKYLVWDKGVKETAVQMQNKGVKVLKFPKEAKERAKNALTKFSQRVTIKGDFDDPNLIKKKSRNTPIIRLQPAGEDLVVSVLIKPLAKDDLTLLPGVGSASLIHRSAKGERIQIARNIKKEVQILQDLKDTLPTLQAMDGHEIDFDNEEVIIDFLSDVKEFAPKVELQWPKGETLRIAKVASLKDFNINVKSGVDWFEVNGKVQVDADKVWSIKELLEASAGGSRSYIKIDDTTYVKLKKNLQKRLSELASIGQETSTGLQVHKLGASALGDIVEGAGKSRTDKGWKDNQKKIEALREFKPEMPSNLQAELRPYQLEGYNWLSRLQAWDVGACLADDMGLGKTIQAIALMLKLADKGASLVIAPSSVCTNWHKEIMRFAPTLNTVSLALKGRKKAIKSLKAFDVLVVSYGLIQSNPDLLADKEWNIIVLDEAHAIKNAHTMRSKAAMKLKGQFKILTTGTPIQNHLGELWNLFQFINPGFLGSYDSFNQRFVNGTSDEDVAAKRKALNRLITPFILRRNKSDVLDDLPEKTEITLTIEQSESEKALYEALRQKAVSDIEDAENMGESSHLKILAQLSKLRLASCHPCLVDSSSHLESSKMNALESLVDDLLSSKHKALVFSQFTKHLALIKEMLDKKGITYQYLDGSTSIKNREKAIANFQSGKSDLFLISLKAGGVGLNLTAADYVIHMDPWWNPAVEDQASDRAHRIGQIRPVTVYRLVSEGTIEEKIVKLHHAKRDLADHLLADTDQSAKISSAELFELMK